MLAEPVDAISGAEMEAVSCVGLTIVVRAEPFQLTTDAPTKFVPFTVRVNPEELQEGVIGGDNEVIAGGAIVKGIDEADVPPPGLRLNTAT